jgi:outer membrane protein
MKNISIVLNVILFVLIGVLFYLHFSGAGKPGAPAVASVSDSGTSAPVRIAYVNIDSLELHYSYFQVKKEELTKKQTSIQQDLAGRAKELRDEVAALQKKAPTMTQAQGEAAQKKIMEKQQALQQREQSLGQDFQADQQRFNAELHSRLDNFLKKYNQDKGYTYILSYSDGASDILYKEPSNDITEDVIQGLNALETNQGK